MTFSAILNVLLLLALVVWLGYRQSTWRPIRPGRMWRMPILLGLVARSAGIPWAFAAGAVACVAGAAWLLVLARRPVLSR